MQARHQAAEEEAAGERRQAEQLAAFAEQLIGSAGAERDDVLEDAKALDAALAQLAHRRTELDKEARAETGNMERLRAERDAAPADLERRLRRQDQFAAKLARARSGAGSSRSPSTSSPRRGTRSGSRRSGASASTSSAPAPEVTANAIYREFDAAARRRSTPRSASRRCSSRSATSR